MLTTLLKATLYLLLAIPWPLYAATYYVGPSRTYQTLQQVAGILNPGDRVEVDGDSTYPGDLVFSRPGSPAAPIHIQGIRINGRRPIISGGTNGVAFTTPWPYNVPEGGHHYIFAGFEVANASNRGIFHQARDLTIRDVLVRDSRNGILGADQGSGSLLLEYTEITRCGQGGSSHQIYMATDEVNNPGSVFRMQHNYLHNGNGGNNVKTRAERNEIYYNWIEGGFYHELELIGPDTDADGGNPALRREDSDVVGNVLFKKPTAAGNNPDFYVIRIGGDGTGASNGRYRFVNNTIIAGTADVFRMFDALESVEIHNNVLFNPHGAVAVHRTVEAVWASGQPVITGHNNWIKTGALRIPPQLTGTLSGNAPGFVDIHQDRLAPASGSPLINAGHWPTVSPSGFEFPNPLPTPLRHPPSGEIETLNTAAHRVISGVIDIGAFEFTQAQATGTGSLQVRIEPEAARAANAQWRRVGTSVWRNSDTLEEGIPAGTYLIEFTPVSGWERPAQPSLSISGELPLSFTGHYAPHSGNTVHIDDSNQTSRQEGTAQYPYRSLQAAIDAASSGDTLKVAVGHYSHVTTRNKALSILGGYPGADSAVYSAGTGGDFSQRVLNPAATMISGGMTHTGLTFTRNTEASYYGVVDNLTVHSSRKGIVCDTENSWPHPDHLRITNTIVENNGRDDEQNMYSGAGIILCGGQHQIQDSVVRNNRGGWGAGIYSRGSDDSTLLLANNRIENNRCYVDSCHGAGLSLFAGTKTITGNLIAGNLIDYGYGWGGGVFTTGPGVTYLSYNVIRNNHAPSYGGGVFVDGAIAYLSHDLIHHNTSGDYGGAGIAVDNEEQAPGQVYLNHCTVAHNTSTGLFYGGNGVYVDNGSTATVTGSIFWGNGDDFYVRPDANSSLSINWSLSEEHWSGTGNQHINPRFANPETGDFHLRSTAGRYDPNLGSWVIDTQHSPAIDAGNPTAPFNHEPIPNGGRVNLGAFGNTRQASLSASQVIDLDTAVMQQYYLAYYGRPADLGGLAYWLPLIQATSNEPARLAVLDTIRASFGSSAQDEFVGIYGQNISVDAFFDRAYANILNRAEQDAAARAYWLGILTAQTQAHQNRGLRLEDAQAYARADLLSLLINAALAYPGTRDYDTFNNKQLMAAYATGRITPATPSDFLDNVKGLLANPQIHTLSEAQLYAAVDALLAGASANVTLTVAEAIPTSTTETAGLASASALTWSELPQGLQVLLSAHNALVNSAQLSADGTLIVFATDAALVWQDDNQYSDIYAYEVNSDRLTLISATATGQPGNGPSTQLIVAGDWMIYHTQATNLGAEGSGLYRHHRYTGQRELIGRDRWGQADPQASHPAATADGELIAYQRPDEYGRQHIYLTDTLRVERISVHADATLGLLDHCCAALSQDGHFIAYREQGTQGLAWLHILDRDTGQFTRLPWPDTLEHAPQFSHDGTELWWINPVQGLGQIEVLHRVDNPLR